MKKTQLQITLKDILYLNNLIRCLIIMHVQYIIN